MDELDEHAGPAPAPAAKVEPSEEVRAFPLDLDEVCRRLSMTDRRVELISAFHFDERRAGRMRDMESAYRERFVAFEKRPTL